VGDILGRVTSPAPVVGGGINQAGELRSARVESIRALAALSVLVAHALVDGYRNDPIIFDGWHRFVQAGGFGVFVFFSLSGYLLFRPFVRANWGERRPLSMRQYAINRAVRILPLYYAVFLVYVFVRQHGGSFDLWWRFLLVFPNYDTQTLRLVDGGMWSIVVEVEFYVLLPLFAWVLAKLSRGSLTTATMMLVGIACAALSLRLLTVTWADAPSRPWQHSILATFVFFTPGMLLAMLQQHLGERRLDSWPGPLGHADAWTAGALGFFLVVAYRYNLETLLIPGSFLLLGAAVLPLRPGVANRVLEWRPLAVLGVASYSLYLWHGPIVLGLSEHLRFAPLLLVSLAICIPIALLSFRLIETPFLRFRRRWQGTGTSGTQDTFVATSMGA
jgi:peptidoglycan/LPS O-acetylase OafA/YrhL